MIDSIGGVDVVSNDTFTVDGVRFTKGQQTHVNGDQALKFIRSRKEEGAGGDFGRQQRQQLCLKRWPIRLQAHHRLHILIV